MDIKGLHNKAMELADMADLHKFHKEYEEAQSLYIQAFEQERKAAIWAYENHCEEPTTSVLIRSAASLAYNAKEYRESERMIALGLLGNPPTEIAEELRDLLEMVNFERHMALKGIRLQENDIQLVVAGKGVSYGMAKSEEVLGRIGNFVRLTERTIERKAGRQFRKKGQISKELKHFSESYISIPRAASLAFTIRFSEDMSTPLPKCSSIEEIIDDITTNIKLINDNNIDALKVNIPNDSYRSNFLGLIKELAPDGNNVSLFGITAMNGGELKEISLTRNKKSISEDIKNEIMSSAERNGCQQYKTEEFTGILSVASAIKNTVKISTDNNKNSITLEVPDGLSDIVKNYWDSEVKVTYRKKDNKNTLEMIENI